MRLSHRLLLSALGVGGMLGFLVMTEPQGANTDVLNAPGGGELVGYAPDGKTVFHAAGCGSCHTDETGETLGGGKAFVTDFGTFYAPNISSHWDHGIGQWSSVEFADAVLAGVSPDGAHYYPAFPYAAYAKMTGQDLLDLQQFLLEQPAVATPSRPHEVRFPFNINRALGIWKHLYLRDTWVLSGDLSEELIRGRYLVVALGHCAECHTPRTALGGLRESAWMRGAENPSGEGRIPSIHPDDLGWSAQDIEIYLETGFTPEFDTVGGAMVDVVDNTAQLSASDRAAIAAYLLALP